MQAFSKIQKSIITQYDIKVATEYAKTQAKRKMMKELLKSINEALGDFAKGYKTNHQSLEDVANLSREENNASDSEAQAQKQQRRMLQKVRANKKNLFI